MSRTDKDFVPEQSVDFLNGRIMQAQSVINQIQSAYDGLDGKLEGKEGENFKTTLDIVKAVRAKLSGAMDAQRHDIKEFRKRINIKRIIANNARESREA